MIRVYPPHSLHAIIDPVQSVFDSLFLDIQTNGFGDPNFDPLTSVTNTTEDFAGSKLNTGALVMTLNDKPPAPAWTTNHGVAMRRISSIGDVDEFKITYLFWMSNNLVQAGGGNRALWSFKTGGVGGNSTIGDFRMGVRIMKQADDTQRFEIYIDNGANNGLPLETYFIYTDNKVDVIDNVWARFTVHVNRPTGILKVKYNDISILDGGVKMYGDQNLPLTRLFICSNYTGGNAPQTTKMADLEIFA